MSFSRFPLSSTLFQYFLKLFGCWFKALNCLMSILWYSVIFFLIHFFLLTFNHFHHSKSSLFIHYRHTQLTWEKSSSVHPKSILHLFPGCRPIQVAWGSWLRGDKSICGCSECCDGAIPRAVQHAGEHQGAAHQALGLPQVLMPLQARWPLLLLHELRPPKPEVNGELFVIPYSSQVLSICQLHPIYIFIAKQAYPVISYITIKLM